MLIKTIMNTTASLELSEEVAKELTDEKEEVAISKLLEQNDEESTKRD